MKKTLLLIIIIFVVGFLIVKNKKSYTPIETPVVEKSVLGCYVDRLGKDIYTLNITSQNDGKIEGTLGYNNFEKDSSHGTLSGMFKDNLLIGNYTFSSEGTNSVREVIFKYTDDGFIQGFGPTVIVDGREVLSDVTNVSYDINSKFSKENDCVNVAKYTEASGNYSFNYNPLFMVRDGEKKLTTDWKSNNTKTKGVILSTLVIPKSFAPQTNFSEAKMTISRSSDTSAIKNCKVEPDAPVTEISTATIDGNQFTKFKMSDAGAGNFYETTSYHSILDGDCYVIEYTIHSTNIGNYDPSQNITEFDRNSIENILENTIQSLHFQLASN